MRSVGWRLASSASSVALLAMKCASTGALSIGVRAALDVVVQVEFVRMRTERYLLELPGPLVLDPVLDQIFREDVAPQQVLVIRLERVEHLAQAARRGLNLGRLLGLELVDVLVDRRRRLDLVLNAIQAGHQACREAQVRVTRRI